MSESVAEFVDGVDGVRGGIAEAIARQFDTVAELSQARADTLTPVRGVGPVLAERILEAARTAVIADHTPESEPDADPATRARATVAQARASTRPALDVIEGGVEEAADHDTAPTTTAEDGTDLPGIVVRLATLVGTTIGWGIRICRNVTQPVHHLLRRG